MVRVPPRKGTEMQSIADRKPMAMSRVRITLGSTLSVSRTQRSLSLSDAARQVGELSSSYLHKLERDDVRKPSPTILRRLASFYGLEYSSLMKLAGYGPDNEDGDKGDDGSPLRALEWQNVTAEEAQALLGVLSVMRSSRSRRGRED